MSQESSYGKILAVGPNIVHTVNFIHLIRNLFKAVLYIGEQSEGNCDSSSIQQQELVVAKSFNLFEIRRSIKKIQQLVQREKPAVVHIQQVNRLAFWTVFALRKTQIPVVVTAWGSDVLLMPQKNAVYKFMVGYVLKHCAVCTADSLHMINVIKGLSPNVNTALVFLGIDPIPVDMNKKKNIVFSNRMHKPLYNIDRIIDVFDEFQKDHQDWKLVIGGNGPDTDKLKQQVEALNLTDKVQFVGWLSNEENRNWYQKARVYISIPDSDGTAVSLLEAMSAGCVPVVSDLPVSREWISDGENGVIATSYKGVIAKALELDARQVAEKNHALINEKGTKSIAIEAFQHIYQNVIKHP